MADASSMNGSARIFGLVLGVALIAVGSTGLAFVWESESDFTLGWSESELDSTSVALANGASETLSITVADARVSSIMIHIPQCDDTFVAQVQNPATISWTLERVMGTEVVEVGNGQSNCAAIPSDGWIIPIHGVPDFGVIKALDETKAADAAWNSISDDNFTGDYRLSVDVTRPASPAQTLPVGQPTLAANIEFVVMAWDLTVSKPEVILR